MDANVEQSKKLKQENKQLLFSTISNIFPKMDFKDKHGICCTQKPLENTAGAIEKMTIQRNTGHTRRRQTKQKHNTICVGHHYAEANTNNVNKT